MMRETIQAKAPKTPQQAKLPTRGQKPVLKRKEPARADYRGEAFGSFLGAAP